MKNAKYQILLLLFFLTVQLRAQNALKLENVTENTWVIMGGGGNIGVLKHEDGFLLVDDMFEQHFDEISKKLKEIADLPVRRVVNTHFHYDHADGNKAFGTESEIVAHSNTLNRLRKTNLITVPGSELYTQKSYPEHALPDLTFKEQLLLDVGSEQVIIHHLKNAHTDTDLIVYFSTENVIHCGDVFVRYGVPFMDFNNGGSVQGFIEGLDFILDLSNGNTKIIPGHGQVCSRQEVKNLRDDLNHIYEKVLELKGKGKTESEILSENLFPEMFKDSWLPVSYLVSEIYRGN